MFGRKKSKNEQARPTEWRVGDKFCILGYGVGTVLDITRGDPPMIVGDVDERRMSIPIGREHESMRPPMSRSRAEQALTDLLASGPPATIPWDEDLGNRCLELGASNDIDSQISLFRTMLGAIEPAPSVKLQLVRFERAILGEIAHVLGRPHDDLIDVVRNSSTAWRHERDEEAPD